ncbi:MAG TPA: hypothetical protein ENK97_03515 [Campylobacteraceae bacterium]|nr:hypothetical protein [Campylobacteraceae bacterium]
MTAADTTSYLRRLEAENNISYDQIRNSRASYITSMCYTKTVDDTTQRVYNPCYSCHTNGKEPNYINDSGLQLQYNFPQEILKNPFTNLFKDRSAAVTKISDDAIWRYVAESNYFDANGTIALAQHLPAAWKGYRPDCYYNFDAAGFDHAPDDSYTGWRAFRYYPFLGTFWPTNGSTDDVLIRLDAPFRETNDGQFDAETYALNLAIVEAVVKEKNIALEAPVDETKYGVDLNQNGLLDTASRVVFNAEDYFRNMSYVGKAKKLLSEGKLHLAGGLFPEGTEFLHSVRYIGWDAKAGHISLAKRLKELRYARKQSWKTYSELDRIVKAEYWEAQINGIDQTPMEVWRGNFEEGLKTRTGWRYQGFIEDKKGALRPQTHEETINCMGCHAGIGATTDTIFSFPRKFEGTDPEGKMYGWNHWSQKGLSGVPDQIVSYQGHANVHEYTFYLLQNHSGNEFRNNEEVIAKFFDADGTLKETMRKALRDDISVLLYPSKGRAAALNKGYKALVEEQSYIYGRDANVKPMQNVYREIESYTKPTGIEAPILREY